MEVETGEICQVLNGTDVDRYPRRENGKCGIQRAPRGIAQQQRPHDELAALDDALDDQAPLCDEQSPPGNQVAIPQVTIRFYPWVARAVDSNLSGHSGQSKTTDGQAFRSRLGTIV
jgi:hypothetical protein